MTPSAANASNVSPQNGLPSRERPRLRLHPRLLSVGTVVAVLAVWFLLTEVLHAVSPLKMPYPSGVWTSASQLGFSIVGHIGATLLRIYAGFLLGSIAGVAVGLLMHMSPRLGAILEPVVEALRPIPALAFIPFFILWMGIDDAPKILLVALGSFLTLTIATIEAVKNVPRVMIQAAQTLGAAPNTVYRTVVLHAIAPTVFGAVRLAAALSFTIAIAAEFMGAQTGIGYIIIVAQRTLATDAILYGIVILAILSFITDRVIQRVGRYALRWTDRI